MYDNQYYDPAHEAGYSGARNLLRVNRKGDPLNDKVEREKIYKWLSNQDAYTLHKPVRRKFPRLHYNISGIDQLWEADLMVMSSLKQQNDGYEYILLIIDALSKFVWLEPLRNKTNVSVIEGLKNILKRAKGRIPFQVQSDSGKEFVGSAVQNFLKSKGIKFRFTRNPDIKASLAERVIRTIKERMYRFFTHKNTKRYIDVLQDIAKAYNANKHTSTLMRPVDVNIYNAHRARENIARRYGTDDHRKKNTKPKYAIGAYVRISRTKGTFEKGYEANWSEEVFKVKRVLRRQGLFIYELIDLFGEDLDGFFYDQELIQVGKERMTEEFQIEEILETRGRGRNKEHLVKWVGYPKKFNSWIKASTTSNI